MDSEAGGEGSGRLIMPITITRVEARDIRFPTSRELIGSDAMHKDPDYSAAYCILHTDHPELTGHGLTFTAGRGNELCVAAIRSLAYLVEGHTLESFTAVTMPICTPRWRGLRPFTTL